MSFQVKGGVFRRKANASVFPVLGLAGSLALAGCGLPDEATLRAQLSDWFALGETVAFASGRGCVAGVFRLNDTQIGSAMPVLRHPERAAQVTRERGRMALDDRALAPDQAMIRIANLDRSLGMRMRRAGLEGRACMDDLTVSVFGHALTSPEAILAYDAEMRALLLVDPVRNLLVISIGGPE